MPKHHNSEDALNEKRLIHEICDDDALAAYAIAVDPANRIIRIQPMLWLGLDVKAAQQPRHRSRGSTALRLWLGLDVKVARQLRDALDEKLAEVWEC